MGKVLLICMVLVRLDIAPCSRKGTRVRCKHSCILTHALFGKQCFHFLTCKMGIMLPPLAYGENSVR